VATTFLSTARTLTSQQEMDLARRIAAGSRQAAFELAGSVGPLIRSQARRVAASHPTLDADDLDMRGWLGAAKAVAHFAPQQDGTSEEEVRHPQFPAFAAPYVHAELMDEVRRYSTPVLIPEHVFKARNGRDSASAVTMPWLHALSLDRATSIKELSGADQAQVITSIDVRRALEQLPDKQRYVMLRIVEGVPAKEIAVELDVGTARVSQLRSKAAELLRESLANYRTAA